MCNNDDNNGNKFSLSVKTLDLTCWRSTSREGATMGSRLTTHSEKGHDDDNGDDGDANGFSRKPADAGFLLSPLGKHGPVSWMRPTGSNSKRSLLAGI